MSSCQMPKEEAGPPTLVLPVPPLPRPGLKRTPSWSVRSPLHALPYASSCRSEHAQVGQVGRELLRAQADLVRGDARRHRAAHLEPAARVDVQPERVEELQHRRVGQSLHGEAHREAEGVREVHRLERLPLERRLVVHEERRAKLLAKLQGPLRGEEAQLLRRGLHRRRGRARGSGGVSHRGGRRRTEASLEGEAGGDKSQHCVYRGATVPTETMAIGAMRCGVR